jgi:hypothetical protein
MNPEEFLDCCDSAKLEDRLTLVDTTHESEVLRQCTGCGSWWFYRFHEYVSFDGPDDITQWYSVLTQGDAASIMRAEGRPDLSFLAERRSFMIDNRGVQKVEGQPTYPWGY